MRLFSRSFSHNDVIPEEYAFCVPEGGGEVSNGDNLNPHLGWEAVPEDAKSLALTVVDRDVPSEPDDVNQENTTVPATLERVDFPHWILYDVSPDVQGIEEGAWSERVIPGGKDEDRKHGANQGINGYTDWFAGDDDMEGTYFGYDGPCPPWNDERVHNYVFTLYALDVSELGLDGEVTLDAFEDSIEGHVLETSTYVGRYSLNPRVLRRIR